MSLLKQLGTGRHPHEVLVLVAAVVIGVQGFLLPAYANPAVHALFGPAGGWIFFASLAFFSLVALYGIRRGKIDGLLVERAGLAVLALFFVGFAAAILDYRGITAAGSATFPICLAAANVWRIRQIGKDLRSLRAHLKTFPAEGAS